MKKLKCSSCGGNLVVDSSNEYATCEHCDTKYKLNEDLNVNIRMDNSARDVYNGVYGEGQQSKLGVAISVMIFFIIGAIICVIVASMGFSGFSSSDSSTSSDFDKSSFNLNFLHANGSKMSIFVEHTLDSIIESNKANSRKISLVYEGRETTDEKEIIDIKHSLSGVYEVSVDYDSDGYINRITLEKIN